MCTTSSLTLTLLIHETIPYVARKDTDSITKGLGKRRKRKRIYYRRMESKHTASERGSKQNLSIWRMPKILSWIKVLSNANKRTILETDWKNFPCSRSVTDESSLDGMKAGIQKAEKVFLGNTQTGMLKTAYGSELTNSNHCSLALTSSH